MSETVKLIIEIDKEEYSKIKEESLFLNFAIMTNAIKNSTPLDDVKVEIFKAYDDVTMYSCDEQVSCFASRVSEILDNIGKGDKE